MDFPFFLDLEDFARRSIRRVPADYMLKPGRCPTQWAISSLTSPVSQSDRNFEPGPVGCPGAVRIDAPRRTGEQSIVGLIGVKAVNVPAKG
jgi:hypothetical protein